MRGYPTLPCAHVFQEYLGMDKGDHINVSDKVKFDYKTQARLPINLFKSGLLDKMQALFLQELRDFDEFEQPNSVIMEGKTYFFCNEKELYDSLRWTSEEQKQYITSLQNMKLIHVMEDEYNRIIHIDYGRVVQLLDAADKIVEDRRVR